MSSPIRVLIADDSAFARKVLRELLSATPGIEVIGIARDGLEALEKIAELRPDVVTLDLVMPNLDGLGVLKNLPAEGAPRVVLVSISDASSELAMLALESGAVDLVQKPTALATDQLYELGAELVAKVKVAAHARPSLVPAAPPAASIGLPAHIRHRVVVIGTSTGGPQALNQLLPCFPAGFPLPIAMALHIPAGYTEALAGRLHDRSAINVVEASEGRAMKPGLAMLARGGDHLALQGVGDAVHAYLTREPRGLLHVPSVDVLFESAVKAYGSAVLGVVLTGMGDDGRRGALAIREAGGSVLTEAEASCVVYGMPRAVVEAGASSEAVLLSRMAERILAHL
jgi:two-component system chemotaxis response regulator CheB